MFCFYKRLISSHFTDIDDEDLIGSAGKLITSLPTWGLKGNMVFSIYFFFFFVPQTLN